MRLVCATIIAVLTTPLVAWWLVGDQSTAAEPDADYFLRAPSLPTAVEIIIGVVATTLLIGSVVVLYLGVADRRWWSALLPVLVAGVLAGYVWRLVTAGTIGANIGLGLALMTLVPLAGALIVFAAFRAIWLSRRR